MKAEGLKSMLMVWTQGALRQQSAHQSLFGSVLQRPRPLPSIGFLIVPQPTQYTEPLVTVA